MGSRGSVIPLFISQILNNQPLTITDPHMTRFIMSLDESVELVEYAFDNANAGDIFVQKAPSTTLHTLAVALQEIFNVNNPINIIGTRHSEKLHETLMTREEMRSAEDLGRYYRIPADNRDLNYAQYFTEGHHDTSENVDYSSNSTNILGVKELIDILLNLEPIKELIQ